MKSKSLLALNERGKVSRWIATAYKKQVFGGGLCEEKALLWYFNTQGKNERGTAFPGRGIATAYKKQVFGGGLSAAKPYCGT
jgi:hypothetical protein